MRGQSIGRRNSNGVGLGEYYLIGKPVRSVIYIGEVYLSK